jgi:hypothetical protein
MRNWANHLVMMLSSITPNDLTNIIGAGNKILKPKAK